MLVAILLLALHAPDRGSQGGLQIPLPIPHKKVAAKPESYTVADLVGALDQVRPTTYASPDTWTYEDNPIYEALYEKGTEAVEPLIGAFASDDRPINNTVEGVKQDRFKPVRAKDIAYRILLDILDCADVFDINSPPTPKELLAYWRANRNLSRTERHLNVLKDDDASVSSWARAAQRLTDPIGSSRRIEAFRTGAGRSGMLGEPLRKYGNPSVTELMSKRLRKAADMASPTGNGLKRPDERDLDTLVRSFAKWDRPGSLETFQTLCRYQMEWTPSAYYLDHLTLLLVDARVKAGDTSAIADYLAWIKPITKVPGAVYAADFYHFQPFGAYSENSAIRKAVAEIIHTPSSLWSPMSLSGYAKWFIASPLLVIPEFYDLVLEDLSDKEMSSLRDPQFSKKRVCDLIASQVELLHGAPKFDASATEADRDLAILKMKDFLKANRTRPGDLVDWPSSWRDIL